MKDPQMFQFPNEPTQLKKQNTAGLHLCQQCHPELQLKHVWCSPGLSMHPSWMAHPFWEGLFHCSF